MAIVVAILEQPVIETILTHLVQQPRAPPQAPARRQPRCEEPASNRLVANRAARRLRPCDWLNLGRSGPGRSGMPSRVSPQANQMMACSGRVPRLEAGSRRHQGPRPGHRLRMGSGHSMARKESRLNCPSSAAMAIHGTATNGNWGAEGRFHSRDAKGFERLTFGDLRSAYFR